MSSYEHIPGVAERIALKDQVSDAVLKERREAMWSNYGHGVAGFDNIATRIADADQASDAQLRAQKAGEWKNYFAYGGPMSTSLHGLGGIPEDIAAEEKKIKTLRTLIKASPYLESAYGKDIDKAQKRIDELKAIQKDVKAAEAGGSGALKVGSKPFNSKSDAARIAREEEKAKAREMAKLAMLAARQAKIDAGLPLGPSDFADGEGGKGGMLDGNMPLILGGIALAGAAFWYLKKRKGA